MSGMALSEGLIFDPLRGTMQQGTLRVSDGLIDMRAGTTSGDTVVNVSGHIVSPGLVDMHTHVFSGQDLGVNADRLAFGAGVTSMVDAGSAGAHLIGAFRASTLAQSSVRIKAFLNIASIGTTSIRLGGELRSPWYSSESEAIDAINANRDCVIGVKVRASADVGGEFAKEALEKARRVADAVDLPLMVHLGPPPADIEEILELLGNGDVLTHAFTGWDGNTLLNQKRMIRSSVWNAQSRGVMFDVGHGMSGFSLDVAQRALAEGFLPNMISTDLHAYSQDAVVDLPTVLSKFLALGMDVEDILRAATSTPGAFLGKAVGTLTDGAEADLAVIELSSAQTKYQDAFGGSITGSQKLRAVMTVRNGAVVFDRRAS